MKGKTMRCLAIMLLLCQLPTSCYNYRSVAKSGEAVPLGLQECVVPNTLYRIKMKTGEERKMSVTRVDEQNLYGTLYTPDQMGNELEAPGTLPLSQVESLKERQFSLPLTIGAIAVPFAALLVAGYLSMKNWNPFPNGI